MPKLLEAMQTEDIDAVLAVIESQDDDDAEEAESGYRAIGGCLDQYVIRHTGKIIGVTGYLTPPECDQTYWLSWTYVDADYANQGNGRKMLNELIAHLKEQGGRMLFVNVSDYVDDEEGGDGAIYAAALHLYQSLGFKIEITHPNYYDKGESQIVLGLRLSDSPAMIADFDVQKEVIPVNFSAVFEIADTDDAYSFAWNDEGDQLFSSDDVKIGLDDVKNKEGRIVFLSFPSNYTGVAERLVSAGFNKSGVLPNYYEDGIHDEHFTFTI
ncbi:MAG TPA: GNAT family N-acetyltransferase [Leucothrix sp.]|nr:GNAT family N-acetyltransferase [Leucothrix sp.]